MKYINKYVDETAYTADTNRPVEEKTVSQVAGIVRYGGRNIVVDKKYCGIGDTVVYDKNDGLIKVVKLDTLNIGTLGSNFVIGGTVYGRTEDAMYVVANTDSSSGALWAAPYIIWLQGFDLAIGGSFTITINSTTTAAIEYTTSDTLSSIATKIATALTNAGFTSATGWSVTAKTGYIEVKRNYYTPVISSTAVTDGDSKVIRTTITPTDYQTTLTGFLTPYGFISRNDGYQTNSAGTVWARFFERYSVSGDDLTGQTVGASTIIRQSRFNATDNPLLVAYYGTYTAYLTAKMARFPYSKGAIIDRNGKNNTSRLVAVTYLEGEATQHAYPAAYSAYNYGITTPGYTTRLEATNWWLPSTYEMFNLMKNVTYEVSGATTDAVNRGIYAANGTRISTLINRWTSSESSSNLSWFYYSRGNMNSSGKDSSIYVRPVSAFNL